MEKILLVFLFVLYACQKTSFIDENTLFVELGGSSYFKLKESSYTWLFVNFFAPNCPPCIEELTELKNFYSTKKPEEGFIAIGSTLNAIQSNEETLDNIKLEVQKFVKDYKLTYPIYLADYLSLKKWNIRGFPESFIFKKKNGDWILERKFISKINQNQINLYRD